MVHFQAHMAGRRPVFLGTCTGFLTTYDGKPDVTYNMSLLLYKLFM